MGKKKAFALRLDEDILEATEKWAADEFRSTNGQIEWILQQALKKVGRLKSSTNENNDTENMKEND
ncbi:MAG: Arc family DNA-binding protein, partial [Cytophagales bacterium]